MIRRLITRHLVYLGLAGALVAIASCGGGGGGGGGTAGPSADAPTISDLQIRALDPETPNRMVRYIVAFNFTDQDGDVGNGQCEVVLNGQSIGRATIMPTGGMDPNATSGAVACGFIVQSAVAQQISGQVHIFDRAGHQSNDLTFALGIHGEVPKGAIPEGQKGSFKGRMESATLSR